MSLKDDLAQMAEKLCHAGKNVGDLAQVKALCLEVGCELRGMSRVLSDEPPRPKGAPSNLEETQAARMMALANAERDKVRARLAARQDEEPVMTPCEGGPADGTFAPRSPQMAEGNFCAIAGAKYVLARGANDCLMLRHVKP